MRIVRPLTVGELAAVQRWEWQCAACGPVCPWPLDAQPPVPCPTCGQPMRPTSPLLRRVLDLQEQLAAREHADRLLAQKAPSGDPERWGRLLHQARRARNTLRRFQFDDRPWASRPAPLRADDLIIGATIAAEAAADERQRLAGLLTDQASHEVPGVARDALYRAVEIVRSGERGDTTE